MSNLSAFLHPVTAREEKEVMISDRFRDENGNPVPFKIRALTQEENASLIRQATRRVKVNGQPTEQLDNADLSRRIVVAATVEPDFHNSELCQAYGVLDPLQVPGKMLLAGEYGKLIQAINVLSGFGDEGEEVKN